jgi:hypothetical protein
MPRIPAIATVALAMIIIAGCSYVRPPLEGRQDPHPRSQIHFASSSLRQHTAVDEPHVSRDDAGNLLYVTVPIRSTVNKTLYVDYRATFFDQHGQVLSQTGWFTKSLQSRTPDQITVNSMSPRAADFQIDFRYARVLPRR